MADLIYRFDMKGRHKAEPITDPASAIQRLEDGNRRIAEMLNAVSEDATKQQIIHYDADSLGLPQDDGSPPTQKPFAAVMACSDARVPTELILGQACNDLFIVRVAGNVLGSECLGSLDYAITNLADSLRVVLVLGHSNCGAVTAAVDAFIEPSKYLMFASTHPLRAIVDRLFVAVRAAHQALETVFGQQVEARSGYREALIHVAVALNAAIQAATVESEFRERLGNKISVVYGVYDLATREVRLPLEPVDGVDIWLAKPPKDDRAFARLGVLLAGSTTVRNMVRGL